MNIIEQIQQKFSTFLADKYHLDTQIIKNISCELNTDPKKQQFGDININAAMILVKLLKRNPREIAQEIIAEFKHPTIEKLEIAGPGFINGYFTLKTVHELAQQLFDRKAKFFTLGSAVSKKQYNIEFVSANPTGPLHLGHGRGGIIGDVLSKILSFLGHKVIKEYYINDAGSQMQKLGFSLKIRCQQILGQDIPLPEDAYHGDYLIDLAHECLKDHGNSVIERDIEFFAQYAEKYLLEQIKHTLKEYGITFNVWFSEKKLHTSGAIQKAVDFLDKQGFLYVKDDALWFKSTEFGDDKDRVIKKADGQWTYVAADIAYMLDKINRDADEMIMVLGHDHHSYGVRLEALRQALKLYTTPLEIIFYQLVKLTAKGEQLKMSKRAGTMVTLKEVIELVGKDVARFFYLHRKADAQLDFDLDLALKKTEENPVYYIQYAYVRTRSILAKAAEHPELEGIGAKDATGLDDSERLLLKKIAALKELLLNISYSHQTHQLAYFVIELADLFHSYYAANRVIELENIPQSRARLLLITLLKDTFETTFDLLGITKPAKM